VREPATPSPCIKACRLDQATGLCCGCLRSIEEIVRWGDAEDAERRRILAAVAERRVQQATKTARES
jgi:hypothetical protein